MNLASHALPERGVNHLVTRNTSLAVEFSANDDGFIVALAVGHDSGLGALEALLDQAFNFIRVHYLSLVSCSTGKPASLSQMTVNPRNLVLFGILAGTALVTWVLARVAQEPAPTSVDRGPASEGYYLLDAVMHGTNDDGRIYYRIRADRVEQQADGENFVLERMSVEYTPESDIHWNISASRGLADVNRESLRLQEDVRLVYAPDANQEQTVFETENLLVYTDEFLATTDQRVTMRRGQSEFTATGLELNLQTDFWKLGSDVSIRSTR